MTRLASALATTAMLVVTAPVAAQSMQGMDHSAMPGMQMPAKRKPQARPAAKRAQPANAKIKPAARRRSPARRPAAPMAEVDSTMPGMAMPADQHGRHDMPGMTGMSGATMPGMVQTGTALPAGNAPAPSPPMDHYAERQFPAAEMQRSRDLMMRESGGQPFYQALFNLAEYQARNGRNGYRWDGEAWFGGDINRAWLKSEGEGAFREGVKSAEVQALYSRAIGPYFNLQAGVRHDFQPTPARTYATVGFEGLAPYWFEVEGALFLSTKGDVLGRVEGYYDQRITQRLILQPRVEFNLAAQDVPENRLGSALTDAEVGLRLRYEVRRQFAPYIGVSWEREFGDTRRFSRARGEDTGGFSFAAGIRTWF